jgi:nitrogen fixation/metabolism regulation signal transduction histidine kinase
VKRALRYVLFAAALTVGVLLFLLAASSENAQLFEDYYSWIFGANLAVGTSLFVLVSFLLARLYSRYRRGRFGSKLMTRLVLLFTVMGIVPGIIIYMVSVQFVSRSIESWFNLEVESALESGVKLGRGALEASLADLRARSRRMASELTDMSDATLISQLAKIAEREQLQDVLVVSENGRLIATAGGKLTRLAPELPTQAMITRAKTFDGFGIIEGESGMGPTTTGDFRLRVVVAILGDGSLTSLGSGMRYLQVLQPVPEQLAANAEALRNAYSGYQERALARDGLRRFYLITLTLVLLLAVFAAMVSAFLLATDLAEPLLLLAEGTKAVAEGNLSPRPIVATSDELGTLTQSFNTMTMQLADARAAVERNRQALEDAKAYLESVLANMSAGVMVLDEQLRLVTFNASASRILHQDLAPFQGHVFASIGSVAAFSQPIIDAFSDQNAQSAGENVDPAAQYWQQQIEIPRRMMGEEGDGDIALLARGGRLPVGSGSGYVVVFDDISDLISGQRSIAWAEVARRLAHEIKNPLTPIQLSAERLMMKLQPKLDVNDSALLERGTNTIVNQVLAMQQMVDNFRDYAKTPPPQLQSLDLNALIEEILELYPDSKDLRSIQAHLSEDLPRILGDATQLRQVVHNLLQNAQDATSEGDNNPRSVRIDITTETVHYAEAEGSTRTAARLTVADNGSGFDPRMLARAFEPYATSKRRGTGLGLPVVKKIIEEHGGTIELQNRKDGPGAKVLILLRKLAGPNI